MLMGFAEIVINVARSIIRDSCFLGDHKMKLIVGYSCYKISLVVIGSTQISIGMCFLKMVSPIFHYL